VHLEFKTKKRVANKCYERNDTEVLVE